MLQTTKPWNTGEALHITSFPDAADVVGDLRRVGRVSEDKDRRPVLILSPNQLGVVGSDD